MQVPFLLAHLVQRLPFQSARHVGECPQVPQGFGCLLHQAAESAYVAQVVTLRPVPGGIPQPGHRPLHRLALNVDREHPRPCFGKRFRSRLADSLGGAGDDHPPPFEAGARIPDYGDFLPRP